MSVPQPAIAAPTATFRIAFPVAFALLGYALTGWIIWLPGYQSARIRQWNASVTRVDEWEARLREKVVTYLGAMGDSSNYTLFPKTSTTDELAQYAAPS